MKIETTRFGTLEVAENQLLHFPEGLVGFEHITHYVLIDMAGEGPFKWLQAVGDPDLAFIVTDPQLFWSSYGPIVRNQERSTLGTEGEVYLLSIVSVPDDPMQATANLYAPLAVNARTLRAKQMVLADNTYSLRAPLFPDSTQANAL